MTRFEPDNMLSGCYGCHSYLGGRPQENIDFFISKIGQARYDELQKLSKKTYRNFKKEQKTISKHYRDLFRAMVKGN